MTTKPEATALSEEAGMHRITIPEVLAAEVDRLRAENASLQARIDEHLIMFKSNDETIARYREIIANHSVLTDQLRAENASLRTLADARLEVMQQASRQANAQRELQEAANAALVAENARQAETIAKLRELCARTTGWVPAETKLGEDIREALKDSK